MRMLAAGNQMVAGDDYIRDVGGSGGEDRGLSAAAGAGGADGVQADGYQVCAGSDPDRARILVADRAMAVDGGCLEEFGGGPVAAFLGGEAFVQFDGSHLLEEVDDRVAVGAERQRRARVT